jgi:hypothetical protein
MNMVAAIPRCRSCGCTDDDCSGCIARTGEPCHWIEGDLSSACAGDIALRLLDVYTVYRGSNGDATKALYAKLGSLGPIGVVAVNLFRAQKNSERAKAYRGRGFKGAAYDRKQWAMANLAAILVEHTPMLNLSWGWGDDETQPHHKVVLYIDLPTGQVSFHTDRREAGPDYHGHWDGMRDQSADRICRWCARLLAGAASSVTAPPQ